MNQQRSTIGLTSEIQRMALHQAGVVSLLQLNGRGIGVRSVQRRIAAGSLHAIGAGVYLIGGFEPNFLTFAWAAWLGAGPDSTVSHQSAARIWGLFPEVRTAEQLSSEERSGLHYGQSPIIHLTIPPARRLRRKGVVSTRTDLPDKDRQAKHGLCLTTPLRTVFDLARTSSIVRLEEALDHGLRTRLFSIPQLTLRFETGDLTGARGIAKLRLLVAERADGRHRSKNEFERRAIQALKSAGLHKPVAQYQVRTADGNRYIDLAYPAQRVGIEMDSWTWHGQRSDWRKDRTRNALLTALGWRILPATWEDVTVHQTRFTSLVRQALNSKW